MAQIGEMKSASHRANASSCDIDIDSLRLEGVRHPATRPLSPPPVPPPLLAPPAPPALAPPPQQPHRAPVVPFVVGKQTLRAHDFGALIERLLAQYMPGTRTWLFDNIFSELSSSSSSSSSTPTPPPSPPMLLLVGGGGTGKSVISAKLVSLLPSRNIFCAVHFCRHNEHEASHPIAVISSLAAQLASVLPAYGEFVLERSDAIDGAFSKSVHCDELFDLLLLEPLWALASSDRSPAASCCVLLVIDALDELPPSSVAPFSGLLSGRFPLLPPFVRLFATSRDQSPSLLLRLPPFLLLSLQVAEQRNRQDLRAFLAKVAAGHVPPSLSAADVAANVKRRWPELDVGNRLEALEEPLQRSRQCYEVAAEAAKGEGGYKDILAIKEVRPFPPLKQVLLSATSEDALDALFADAADAREILRNVVAGRWQKRTGSSRVEVPVPGTQKSWVDNAIEPGLKGRERALEKCRNDYAGDVALLKDVARLSLEFKSCARLARAVAELASEGVEIVGLKNKFANPTPMGYRDVNLSVRVTLPDGRKHICEIQINLINMLKAKEAAHKFYEEVRTELPRICGNVSGVSAEDLEAFVMKLLRSSVLDSAVRSLEEKAEGLFIYARLLEAQLQALKTAGRTIDFARLDALPNGLSDMYFREFERAFEAPGSWEECRRAVALIVAAREPLPYDLVRRVLKVDERYFEENVKSSMSLLFPVREGTFHVFHKSVVDWLKANSRVGSKFTIDADDAFDANLSLANQLWRYELWKGCHDDDSWEYDLEGGEKYAVAHGHYHLRAMIDASHFAHESSERGLLRDRALKEWSEALLEPRKSSEQLAEIDENCVSATKTSARLLIEQAKLGRNSTFTAELRDLLRSLEKLENSGGCWVAHLSKFVNVVVWLLGNVFNAAFTVCSKVCFRTSAMLTMAEAPVTSAWFKSSGENSFVLSQVGMFKCSATFPCRNEISSIVMNLLGHSGPINSISFSPDGLKLATASDDKSVRIWNASSGELLHALNSHVKWVTSVSFSPANGGFIASCSEDKTIKLWDSSSGELLRTFTGHTDCLRSVAFSPNETHILSASDDETLKVWETPSGSCVQTWIGHSQPVTSVAFNEKGDRAASGGWDQTIKLWAFPSGEVLNTLVGHTGDITSVAFSPTGRFVVSGSNDKVVKVWDSSSGELLHSLLGHSLNVTCVSYSSDETRIVSASSDKTAMIWDSTSGSLTGALTGHISLVNAASFSPDGKRVVTVSRDKSIKVWDCAGVNKCHQKSIGHTERVNFAAFVPNRDSSANEAVLVVSCSHDKTLKLWDITRGLTGDLIRTFTFSSSNASAVTTLACSPNGRRVVSGGEDGLVSIWSIETGEILNVLPGHAGCVTSIGYSSDSEFIISSSQDKTTRIWNSCTGELVRALNKHTSAVTCLACSPDSSTIASGSQDNSIILWALPSGELLHTFLGNATTVKSDAYNRFVTSVAFSPRQGSLIVSGSNDRTIKLWEVSTKALVRTFSGHLSAVTCVIWRDGGQVVSCSHDRSVMVWDVASGENLQSLNGHADRVTSVACLPNGKKIVSTSVDKTIKIWDVAPLAVDLTQTLSRLLKHLSCSNIARKSEACRTLCALASGSQTCIQAIFEAGLLQPLLSLLDASDAEARFESVRAIIVILGSASNSQVEESVRAGCIPALCALLSADDAKIEALVLTGLERIISVGMLKSEDHDHNADQKRNNVMVQRIHSVIGSKEPGPDSARTQLRLRVLAALFARLDLIDDAKVLYDRCAIIGTFTYDEVANLPGSLSHPAHEHALQKLDFAYEGEYTCDVCMLPGSLWVYHCEVCRFDAHPHCVAQK